MADKHAPKEEAQNRSETDAQQEESPKDSLTGQLRHEAIVQSANLFLVARRILTTSLGAIAVSIEETNEFIARLVERGEVAEHELTAMVEEMSWHIGARGKEVESSRGELTDATDTAPPTATDPAEGRNVLPTQERMPALLGDRVESILGRLNVPTRNDIESLTSKIEILSGKVKLLRSKSTRAADPDTPSSEETTETAETAG